MTDAAQLPHAQHVAQRGAVVRGAARGGFRKRQCRAVDGEHRVHAESVGGHRVVRDAADDGDDGDAPLCAAGDAADDLAAQALAARAAPRPVMTRSARSSRRSNPARSSSVSMPGRRVPPSSAMHPKPKPPRRPRRAHPRGRAPFRHRRPRAGCAAPGRAGRTVSAAAPFCGPNTAAAPSGAAEGIVHVAHGGDFHPGEQLPRAGEVNAADLRECPARRDERLTRGIFKAHAERGGRSRCRHRFVQLPPRPR